MGLRARVSASDDGRDRPKDQREVGYEHTCDRPDGFDESEGSGRTGEDGT